MIIPVGAPEAVRERSEWAALDPDAKRRRLLSAAAEVFARDGLEAPMSEVAEAAGAGVASIYRCYPSKRELLAVLVCERMGTIEAAAREACERDGDRWSALIWLLRKLVAQQSADDVFGEARRAVGDHPAVVEAAARATAELERLLADARAEGRLRADATMLDLRLLFAATRAARRVEPERWPRILELLIASLDAGPPSARDSP